MNTLRRVFSAAVGFGLTMTFAFALLISWAPVHASAAPLAVQDRGRNGADKAGSDRGRDSSRESNRSENCGRDPGGGKGGPKGDGGGQHPDPPSCTTDSSGKKP